MTNRDRSRTYQARLETIRRKQLRKDRTQASQHTDKAVRDLSRR